MPRRMVRLSGSNMALKTATEIYAEDKNLPAGDAPQAARVSSFAENGLSRNVHENHVTDAFLAAVLQLSGEAVISLSVDEKITGWNPAAEKLFGYTAAEAIGLPATFLTGEEHAAEQQANFEAVRGGRMVEKETIRFAKDGRPVNVIVKAVPVIDTAGVVVGYTAVMTDVSERRVAEDALREKNELLTLATNATRSGLVVWDLVAHTFEWSENGRRIIGFETVEESREPEAWLSRIHPDDRPLVKAHLEESVRVNKDFDIEYRIIRDGATRHIYATGKYDYDSDGKALRGAGLIIDITDQKLAETALRESEQELRLNQERMQLLTESFTDYAIVSTDLDGNVLSWNIGAEQIFGYKEHEIIGRPAAMVFTREDVAKNIPEREMRRARLNGRSSDERWHVRKDGSRFYASGVMAGLYEGANHIGYAKIARDLTDRKRAEEDLKRSREELETRVDERTAELAETNQSLRQEIVERKHAEQERVELLRKIVTTQEDERRRIARDLHDQMGQRLTALRLKIASLKEEAEDRPSLKAKIERLGEIGARLDAEVNFLAYELRPSALDDLGLAAAIANFVQEWSRHFETAAEFHSSGLNDRRLEPEVETNLYRIAQEALNNTLKHANAANVSVLLERRRNEVVLIIEDDGVGFEPTKQMAARAPGMGLGLIGIRERAAIVCGTVEIESAPDQGTTIYVRVPVTFTDARE